MLDLHRLRLLLELERHGTMAAVAQALSYSPSAISQQIAQLERDVGVPLLEKIGRGVRLTPEARILVRHTGAVLDRLERAEAEVAAARESATGTLRLASFQSVLVALLPDTLSLLAQRHPLLRLTIVELEPEQALTRLREGDLDLVLGQHYPGQAPGLSEGLVEEHLTEDSLHLARPGSGPLAGAPASVADLAEVPWVMAPTSTAAGAWAFRVCRSAGFEPDVRFETPDLMVQLHLVSSGHAVGFLPGLLGTALTEGVRLTELGPEHRRRLTTLTRRATAGHPSVRAVREALATAAGAA